MADEPPKPPFRDEDRPQLTTDESTAAGLVVALGAVGVDLLQVNIVDRAELAALVVVAAATIADDDDGPVGQALRSVGVVSNAIFKEVKEIVQWGKDKEVGLKGRAVAELAVEKTVQAAFRASDSTASAVATPAPVRPPKPAPKRYVCL